MEVDELSEKFPESAILVVVFEVVEVVVERFLESVRVFVELDEVERLRESTSFVLLVVVLTFPESLILVVVDETFPESAILELDDVLLVVFVRLLLLAVVVVVVLGALIFVVEVVVFEVLLAAGTLVEADVVGVELAAVADAVEVDGFVALLTVLVAEIDESSANFQVLKRPFESRTTTRARPSDHVSVTALPHDTKWPLVSRTTQYCFPSAQVS